MRGSHPPAGSTPPPNRKSRGCERPEACGTLNGVTPTRTAAAAALGLWVTAAARAFPDAELPFRPGEQVVMRITWARLLAGRAWLSVDGPPAAASWELTLTARSQGFFAWLTRFRVEDRTVSRWDPRRRCSLGIEKRLREGRHARDQRVLIDPAAGTAVAEDARLAQKHHDVGPCVQDVLSAFFAARAAGFGPGGAPLPVRTFDNGRLFDMRFEPVRRETLDLPPPLGREVAARVFEVRLVPETGVFEQQGRLLLWVTDDERRVPVRLRAKAPVGWVSADLESYTASSRGGSLGPWGNFGSDGPRAPP